MAQINYRTINIDLLDPDSPSNFDLTSLTPSIDPVSAQEVTSNVNQIRQMLRGGDSEGALRAALESAPYGADSSGKDSHAALMVEILQSIRASEMSPLLARLYESQGGVELVDALVKYLYKGMASSSHASPSSAQPNGTPTKPSGGFSQAGGRNFSGSYGGGSTGGDGQAMSVLLSWHEKVVEVAGMGSIVRVMSDRRTV